MTTFDLFSSVRDGNVDVVRKLLQSKACRARLNDRNEWGDTALHLAAEAGNGGLLIEISPSWSKQRSHIRDI